MTDEFSEAQSLERRLDELARRIERIEAALEIPHETQVEEAIITERKEQPAPHIEAAETTTPPDEIVATTEVARDAPTPDRSTELQPPVPEARTGVPARPAAPPTSPVDDEPVHPASPPLAARAATAISRRRPSRPPAPERAPFSLEMFIGGRGMAWMGAIVIIIAIALFLKLAYDQGWLNQLSHLARFIISAIFGCVLIAAGEYAFRKISRFAAVGLFAAGLGVLYVTSFSTTWQSVNLLSEGGAGLLMSAVAAIGFVITMRGRFLSIGILTIITGYASPILLSEGTAFIGALPLYLTMLLGVALALSAFQPRPFRTLRYVALACHAVLGFFWIVMEGHNQPGLALVFLTGWWLMVSAEALLAATRRTSSIGNVVASLLATAWVVTIMTLVWNGAGSPWPEWTGAFALAIAGASVASVFQFGPGIDALRKRPTHAIDKLGIAQWLQTGVLLATAIALQFDGYGESIGWLFLGIASIEVGRRVESRGVDVFGIVVGALACTRIATIDYFSPALAGEVVVQFNRAIVITEWGGLALLATTVVFTAGRRLRGGSEQSRWNEFAAFLTALAVAGYLAWCWLQCSDLAVTTMWLFAPVALTAVERYGRRERYLEIAILTLGFIAIKWVFADALVPRTQHGWEAGAMVPFVNGQMALAVALVAAGVWSIRRLIARSREDVEAERAPSLITRRVGEWAAIIAWAFLLIALSFEVDRTLQRWHKGRDSQETWPYAQELLLWLTALWAAGAIAPIVLAHLRRAWATVRDAGWAFLCASAFVWLAVDTIGFRIQYVPADTLIIFNLQCIVGMLLIVFLVIAARLWITGSRHIERNNNAANQSSSVQPSFFEHDRVAIALAAVGFIGLWLGSLEIDRWFEPAHSQFENAAMARQAGLSIYWGVYALALIALGFIRRINIARYAGLGLLVITLGKVFLIDLGGIEAIYRVLSFLAVGVLAVITSIAYARFAPALLGESIDDNMDHRQR